MKIAIVGRRLKPDKSKLWCTNCQRTRHTKENCFLIVGFPEWWDEGQKAKARLAVGIGEGGGGLFHDTAGNREAANTRGRSGDATQQQGGGGGGRRGGESDQRIGEAAFAERRGIGGNGGLGIGSPNPQFNNVKLLHDPSNLQVLEKRPHYVKNYEASPCIINFMHNSPRILQIGPQPHKIRITTPILPPKSFLSPNRFAPLEKISIACMAQSKTDTKESGWIFDCGATDTMSYDKNDFSAFTEATKSSI